MSGPRIEMANTYLMAWYAIHNPPLISIISSCKGFFPFVQRLEGCIWTNSFMLLIRLTFLDPAYYCFFERRPAFFGVDDDAVFTDATEGDGLTCLAPGLFRWLVNICPGYLDSSNVV